MRMKIELILLCCIVLLINNCECNDDAQNENRNRKARLLVGAYSTRTYISLTTFTSTVVSTCQLTVNAVACRKRRRRNARKTFDNTEMNEYDEPKNLNPSTSIDQESPLNDNTQRREGRLKITFWSTVTSSYTLVSTVANTASRQSISYFCSVAGFSYPPVCA